MGTLDSKGSRRHFRWKAAPGGARGLFEQGDQPLDFAHGLFVGLLGAGGVVQDGVDQHGHGLGDAVENEQLVGDEEIHHRRLQFVARRARHDRFDVVDELVADEPDGPAGEPRQAGHRTRPGSAS